MDSKMKIIWVEKKIVDSMSEKMMKKWIKSYFCDKFGILTGSGESAAKKNIWCNAWLWHCLIEIWYVDSDFRHFCGLWTSFMKSFATLCNWNLWILPKNAINFTRKVSLAMWYKFEDKLLLAKVLLVIFFVIIFFYCFGWFHLNVRLYRKSSAILLTRFPQNSVAFLFCFISFIFISP